MAKIGSRSRWLASTALTALIAGASVLLITGGVASGSPSSAQYQYGGPTNSVAPAVTGTAKVGQTLTTSNGTWSNASATYTYAWNRCDTTGANCASINGATASTYVLVAADQGHTIRSAVTATDSTGTSAPVQSAQTATVTALTGGTIAAADVVLPNLLQNATITFSQNPIRARKTPTTMKIHVTDLHDNSVVGALVQVQGVPYSRIDNIPEATTDSTGWATVQIQPGPKFPHSGYITMFIRARVPGQDLLAGSSSRRLVQATIGTPNGT